MPTPITFRWARRWTHALTRVRGEAGLFGGGNRLTRHLGGPRAADEIDPDWLEGRRRIGVTAGASAPDVLVEGVLARLQSLGAKGVRELAGEPEGMVFALPKELRVQLVD